MCDIGYPETHHTTLSRFHTYQQNRSWCRFDGCLSISVGVVSIVGFQLDFSKSP